LSRSFPDDVVAQLMNYRVAGGSKSGDQYVHSDAPPHRGPLSGGEQLMMIGWAYLMAAIMTVDSFLLGSLLLNVKWPKRWKKRR
jgi:hypothetical protein